MRRSALILVLPALIPVVLAVPALAGGNWLEVRPGHSDARLRRGDTFVPYVGQNVIAFTSLYVQNPDRRERLRNDGPFYVWLSPGRAYLDDIRLPNDAMRLAPVEIRWSSTRSAAARARFTIPEVTSGPYELLVCNDPCTLAGFGEYVQGWVTIMQTPDEARFMGLSKDRRWDLRSSKRDARRLERRNEELVGALSATRAELTDRTTAVRAATTRLEAARAERQGERPIVTEWQAGLLAIALLAAAVIVRRRRRPELVVPDTVPEDLIEREHARV